MFNQEGYKPLKVTCCCLCVALFLCVSLVPSFAASPSLNWGKQFPINGFQSYATTIQDSDTVKYFTFNHDVQSSDDVICVVQSVPTPVPFELTIMPYENGWAIYGNSFEEGVTGWTVEVSVFSLATGTLLGETETMLGGPSAYVIPYNLIPVDYYTRVASFGSGVQVWGEYTRYFPYQGYDYTKWLNALYIYSVTENEYLRLILEELEQLKGLRPYDSRPREGSVG